MSGREPSRAAQHLTTVGERRRPAEVPWWHTDVAASVRGGGGSHASVRDVKPWPALHGQSLVGDALL
jgi:hypothetical protein